MVYCGNNVFAHSLKPNGGTDAFGTHRECFRKGYATGYNQAVTDVPKFIQQWSAQYKPYIAQKLWHNDSEPVPPGYQRATLSQTMQRGYAIGCVARAAKLKKRIDSRAQHAR